MSMSLSFPGAMDYMRRVQTNSHGEPSDFARVFEDMLNLVELSLHIFIASTVRCYQTTIENPSEQFKKKIKPLKSILAERFVAPSLGTLLEAAKACYYLIDDGDPRVPQPLLQMKHLLSLSNQLKDLATIFNDLDDLIRQIHKKPSKHRTIYKPTNKHELLKTILPKLVEYRNTIKHVRDISLLIADSSESYDISQWSLALLTLIDMIAPISSQKYIQRQYKQICASDDGLIEDGLDNLSFLVDVISYNGDIKTLSEERITFAEYEAVHDHQRSNIATSISLPNVTDEVCYDLFPFALIHEDNLFHYKKTRTKGYEFFSVANNSLYVVPTKRKFNHSLFGFGASGDRQAIFWTEIAPTTNPENGIKANIPLEGIDKFVGRKKQIAKLKEEILEIPNQNGIIYGPGGVGKTALMLQMSKDIFQSHTAEDILFDNIIWISAKTNYYNPLLNVIVEKEKQADSLDNIFNVVLSFFEYENVDEYDHDDKYELVMQVLEENRVLLILDNFETINKKEAEKIIRFLGIDVKKRLKKTPDYFKVIVTSREQIPSGFHQIKLEGLDLRDSKKLMDDLLGRYQPLGAALSEEQKEKIHEVTHGIPITIKHCFGQIFEFNRPFSDVVHGLGSSQSEIIKFSFSEILKLLEKDTIQLEIIILLELIHYPLMIRQMADILEIEESILAQKIPALLNFQVLERINQGIDEKYAINNNISLFSKSIVQENDAIATKISKQVTQNFNLDRKMDYTTEEHFILGLFNDYIAKEQYLQAEEFITSQLARTKNSPFLQYHYAKYLKEHRGEVQRAIDVLSDVFKDGNKHPKILILLVSCYTSLKPPNYKAASVYIKELETSASQEEEVTMVIAEFYISWSSYIKNHGKQLDRIEEIKRRGEYKDLAKKVIEILKNVKDEHRDHKYNYLLAQAYFNTWENDTALNRINMAIQGINNDPQYYVSYSGLRTAIQKKISYCHSFKGR